MGLGFQILHMILIIFVLISFHFTHILVVKASFNAVDYFKIPGLKEMYHTEEIHVERVSGGDENGDQKSLVLDKFRVLLGLRNFNERAPRSGHFSYSPAPSPLPATGPETPAPAPSPLQHIRSHSHPPLYHHHLASPIHKISEKERGKTERILIASFVSVGVLSLLSAIGFFLWCRKFKKQRKWPRTTVPIYNTGISRYTSSQNLGKKVSSDPGPDLFYLNSLESALEPEKCYLKLNSEAQKTYFTEHTTKFALKENQESDEECRKLELGRDRCSDVGEITTAHEISESYEPNCSSSSCGERIVPEEAHSTNRTIPLADNSSDDESFHSFSDSHSCARLSNASAESLNDTSESISQNESKAPLAIHTEMHPHSTSNLSVSTSTLQPPIVKQSPPPPPPPPHESSSTLPNVASLETSDSSSMSKQTSGRDLPLTPVSPPKPVAGIPPPPCPHLPKGNANSFKGPPPPPPSQLTKHSPFGKDGTPLPKLKPLHWDKVRAAPDRSTVWDKLHSSSFEFDEAMIESLFGYNLQNTMKNEEVKSKNPSPSKHVLEPKRLQNITILSKALNVTAEQVCLALIQGDGLSLQHLEALAKMVPTKEEEAKLSNYKGDVNELGSAEKLVKEMLKIPFAFLRIEAMLYRETFEEEVLHLRKSFSMLEEACKELRSSRLFLKLLEAVLKTGNRMNVGTIRGGAKAFKLDTLLKLADVKGTDGKTTLLHFVVQEIIRSEGMRVSESIMGKINQKSNSKNIEDKEENYRTMGLDLVSGLGTELCNVKKTASVDLDVIASSVSNLSDGMSKLQHLVEKDLIMEQKKGNFVNSMGTFLNYAQVKLKELQEDESRVLLHVREITEYFHGDVSKDESNPLRIFVIVRDFLSLLDHVCKELRSSRAPRTPNPLAPFR